MSGGAPFELLPIFQAKLAKTACEIAHVSAFVGMLSSSHNLASSQQAQETGSGELVH